MGTAYNSVPHHPIDSTDQSITYLQKTLDDRLLPEKFFNGCSFPAFLTNAIDHNFRRPRVIANSNTIGLPAMA